MAAAWETCTRDDVVLSERRCGAKRRDLGGPTRAPALAGSRARKGRSLYLRKSKGSQAQNQKYEASPKRGVPLSCAAEQSCTSGCSQQSARLAQCEAQGS